MAIEIQGPSKHFQCTLSKICPDSQSLYPLMFAKLNNNKYDNGIVPNLFFFKILWRYSRKIFHLHEWMSKWKTGFCSAFKRVYLHISNLDNKTVEFFPNFQDSVKSLIKARTLLHFRVILPKTEDAWQEFLAEEQRRACEVTLPWQWP